LKNNYLFEIKYESKVDYVKVRAVTVDNASLRMRYIIGQDWKKYVDSGMVKIYKELKLPDKPNEKEKQLITFKEMWR
tara:strand:+ start:52 stop:282 length:231 start_codon:yes stop_codon:yes gene_type:complete